MRTHLIDSFRYHEERGHLFRAQWSLWLFGLLLVLKDGDD
jgi:hypothetical protein